MKTTRHDGKQDGEPLAIFKSPKNAAYKMKAYLNEEDKMAARIEALETQIDRLRDEKAQLVGALWAFASLDISSADGLKHKDNHPIFGLNRTQFTVGDVRLARSLLSKLAP